MQELKASVKRLYAPGSHRRVRTLRGADVSPAASISKLRQQRSENRHRLCRSQITNGARIRNGGVTWLTKTAPAKLAGTPVRRNLRGAFRHAVGQSLRRGRGRQKCVPARNGYLTDAPLYPSRSPSPRLASRTRKRRRRSGGGKQVRRISLVYLCQCRLVVKYDYPTAIPPIYILIRVRGQRRIPWN